MLQSYLAWYQLFSSHPTSCIAVGWRLDDPHPFPQGPPIPQGGGGLSLFYLYLKSLLLSLCYLIWSSFLYLTWTYILLTYFSIHAPIFPCLMSTYFILSYEFHCWLGVGWPPPLPTGPTHSTGGRGGLTGYDHDHGKGGRGDPEPGTCMCIYIYVYFWSPYIYIITIIWYKHMIYIYMMIWYWGAPHTQQQWPAEGVRF